MEWPPNPMLLFTAWILGEISNKEYCELAKLWHEKHNKQKEKAAQE